MKPPEAFTQTSRVTGKELRARVSFPCSRVEWYGSRTSVDATARFEGTVRVDRDHRLRYLDEVLWDDKYGGFFWGLDEENQPSSKYTENLPSLEVLCQSRVKFE